MLDKIIKPQINVNFFENQKKRLIFGMFFLNVFPEINMSIIDILWIVLGSLCMLAGLLGCILPILPACPLNYLGIILLHLTDKVQFTTKQLILFALLVIFVQVLDYLTPIIGAKKFGGSKAGIWGCTIGIIFGLFLFPPFGIVLGPFLGALIGELLSGKDHQKAIKAGLGSFVGFLFGTVSKVVVSMILMYYFITALF